MDAENMIDGLSKDLEQDAREKLKGLFPDCFVEGKLDIDKLLNLCGEYMTDDFERYNFTWKGKSECYQLVQKRSSGTLRPCPAESVDFDTTQNLYIEGDNLEVLKLLQNSYHRQVKMIYIDPPYNTGHDFVYEDDFAEPLANYKEVIGQATKSNPETMGRFHTNWLNMMYPRLRLAANLLRDDGVVFISIDDNEVHNLRKLCDEVFGEENFVASFIWKCRQNVDSRTKTGVSEDHEYLICYKKSDTGRIRGKQPDMSKYANPDNDPRGAWMSDNMVGLATASQRPNLHYDLVNPATGNIYPCPTLGWRYERSRMEELIKNDEVLFPKEKTGRPRRKKFMKDLRGDYAGFSTILNTTNSTQATRELRNIFDDQELFDFPKPSDLLRIIIEQGTSIAESDLILDFFSGSGTTAQAVMQLNAADGGNRRFIMVQLPELRDDKTESAKAGYNNICEIGKERIRRAGQKIQEEVTKASPKLDFEGQAAKALDTGFKVFKLDTSNHKLWDPSPISRDNLSLLEQRLSGMTDRLKPDRSDLDLIYELMLKLGLPLTDEVKPLDIDGKRVWSVGEDCLIAVCLDKDIEVETVEKIAALAPARIIFGQDCFADASAYSNAKLKLRDLGVEHKYV